ncbi:MAG: hypothetical protein ACRD8Z_19315 [Nitrososphaeraceae archaeon]
MPGKYTYVTWKNGRLVKRTKYCDKLNVPEYVRRDDKTNKVKPMHMRGTVRFCHDHYCSTHPGYDSRILDSGYSVNQTWIGLCRAWMGMALSNRYNDLRGLEKYANIIHKLQGELDINKTKFYNAYTYDEDDVEIDGGLRDDTMTDDEWLEREMGRPISLSEARIAGRINLGQF